jgi:hypothetical protein
VNKNGYIHFRPHNLRKWFANQGKKTVLGYTETRHLLGHQIRDPTGKSYLKPDYEHLYQIYYQCMDAFTPLSTIEVHEVTNEKVQGLEERIISLERLLEKRERLDKLK